jgi:hypothetical protein
VLSQISGIVSTTFTLGQKYRKEEFDTDLESSGEQSEWDSEDEWTSEDGGEGEQVADEADNSNVAEQSERISRVTPYRDLLIHLLLLDQPATSRSIPMGAYDSAPQQMGPAHGNNYDRQRSLGQDNTTYHEDQGQGGYGNIAQDDDEDAVDEAVDEVQGGANQADEDDEENQEQEPDTEAYDEGQQYPGDEPVEGDQDEEQDHDAYDEEDDEAGGPVEEGDGEDEDQDQDGEEEDE